MQCINFMNKIMDFIYVTERNFPSSTWFRIKCHSVYEKKFSANQALTNTSVYEESRANNTIVNSRHNFDSNANAIAKFSPAKNKFNVFSLLQEQLPAILTPSQFQFQPAPFSSTFVLCLGGVNEITVQTATFIL